jgi:RNA recognition motif-containing protein
MRLRVSSIHSSITKLKLQEMFEEYGAISSVKLFRSLDDSAPALGFVEMKREKDALSAISDLNGLMIGDSCLKVEISSDLFRTHAAAPPVAFDADNDDEEEEDEEEDESSLPRGIKLPPDLNDELEDDLDDDDEEYPDEEFDEEDNDEEEGELEEIPIDDLDEEI